MRSKTWFCLARGSMPPEPPVCLSFHFFFEITFRHLDWSPPVVDSAYRTWFGLTADNSWACRAQRQDSVGVRNKTLCSDGTEVNLFGLSPRCHVWRKPDAVHEPNSTIPTVDSWGSIRLSRLKGELNKSRLKTWSRVQGLRLKINLLTGQ